MCCSLIDSFDMLPHRIDGFERRALLIGKGHSQRQCHNVSAALDRPTYYACYDMAVDELPWLALHII